MYKSKERLHLARDGRTVVKPGDSRSFSLLVPAGGELTDEQAVFYGLPGSNPYSESHTEQSNPHTESKEAPKEQAAAQANTNLPIQPVSEVFAHDYPKSLSFGNVNPQQTAPVIPDAVDVEKQTHAEGANSQPAAPAALEITHINSPLIENSTPLPENFPYRHILDRQKVTTEKALIMTRDQFVALDDIGAKRADEIIAAREVLRNEKG